MGGRAVNQPSKNIAMAGAVSTGVTLPSGAVAPLAQIGHERLQIYKTTYDFNALTLSLDTAGGGANDGIGQKIGTFPAGHILMIGALMNLSLLTQAGLSGASVVAAVGSTAGADNSATLTTTEADLIASHTFGDGTVAAATLETHNTFKPATLNTALGFQYFDASASDVSAFFNLAGVWTHADTDPATAVLDGTIALLWAWLGDD